jgi:hypothetical protein
MKIIQNSYSTVESYKLVGWGGVEVCLGNQSCFFGTKIVDGVLRPTINRVIVDERDTCHVFIGKDNKGLVIHWENGAWRRWID